MRLSRTTTIGAALVVGALALTGCSTTDTDGGDATIATRTAAPTPTATPTPTPTPEADATDGVGGTAAGSQPKSLTFEDGAELSSTRLPAFGVSVSSLKDWELTRSDPSAGSTEYTRSDGAVATVTQQRVTGLDPTMGDRAATEHLFRAAGAPVEGLEEQLLPTAGGGTAQFLSIAGQADGTWTATVARAFARPGVALTVKIDVPSREVLRDDLHEILVSAQVVIT
jgi:outer membrane lipoprotein SlyB